MNKEYFKNTNDIIGRSDHKLLIDNKSYFDTVQKNYHDFTYNLESNVDISSFNISQCLKDGQKYKCFHNNLNHKEGKENDVFDTLSQCKAKCQSIYHITNVEKKCYNEAENYEFSKEMQDMKWVTGTISAISIIGPDVVFSKSLKVAEFAYEFSIGIMIRNLLNLPFVKGVYNFSEEDLTDIFIKQTE